MAEPSAAARGRVSEAPRWSRFRRWLLRPRVLVPLALLWLFFEAFWPDYQYVWFEADATIDGEPVRFTQLALFGAGSWHGMQQFGPAAASAEEEPTADIKSSAGEAAAPPADNQGVLLQIDEEAYAKEFFFDQPPEESLLSELPAAARDVVVAKVRIVGRISYLIPRQPPMEIGKPRQDAPLPKDLYAAWVEVTEVISGDATVGMRFDVVSGKPATGTRYKVPHTRRMRNQEYFVASYIGDDGVRRLLGSPVSQEEYEQWYEEVREYERARARPGASQE